MQGVNTGVGATLAITGGSLTVTAGLSALSGPLSMTDGSLTASGPGVTLTANGSATVSGASLFAGGGATLSLPGVASYAGATYRDTVLQASGAGGALSLPALTTLTGGDPGPYGTHAQVVALAGGTLAVPMLNQINGALGVILHSDGAGSVLDLSAISALSSSGGTAPLQVTHGGTVRDSNLTHLNGVAVSLDGSDTPIANSWTSFRAGSITLTGGAYTLPGLTDIGAPSLQFSGGATLSLPVLASGNLALGNGQSVTLRGTLVSLPAVGTAGAIINVPPSPGLTVTLQNSATLTTMTVNVGQGTTAALAGGTYDGGMSFSVVPGATVDLTGGQTTSYAGTLTGSGGGTVQVSGGVLAIAPGGVALNFAGNTFQWTGGVISTALGDLTNLGVMNLAGSNEKTLINDGVLDNSGTLIQTGSGNLGLRGNHVAATLKNERGGSYLIESDAGIDSPSGGGAALVNAGIIRKTAGTGTSTLLIAGSLDNTGTIEADSCTLSLAASTFNQVSGTTLTGGTWNATNGAALKFPVGTSIITNAGNITLSGTGATFNAIAGLAANRGFLGVGPGATLHVAGNYTQAPGGTLENQIGGEPATGLFGVVTSNGTAALDGTLTIDLVGGFIPRAGDSYTVVTYPGETGDFAAVNRVRLGLGQLFSEATGPTGVIVRATADASDLALPAGDINVPAGGTPGQPVTVTYIVHDLSAAATGVSTWTDSVYISLSDT